MTVAAPPRAIRWNARAGRYINARGKFVPLEQVRHALDQALYFAEQDVYNLAGALRDRRISLTEWEAGMRRHIRDVNLYSYSLAVGGWGQLSPAQLGKVGAEVRSQYKYLGRFAKQIRSGAQPMDGSFFSRAVLYAKNGRKLQSIAQSEQMAIRGWQEERNHLSPGDSCRGCITATLQGWVPVQTLPPPGTRDCLLNCKCEIAYRNPLTGEVTDGGPQADLPEWQRYLFEEIPEFASNDRKVSVAAYNKSIDDYTARFGDDKEAMDFLDAVIQWTDTETLGAIRTELGAELRGAAASGPARAMLNALNRSVADAPVIHRGFMIDQPIAEVLQGYQSVGRISPPLAGYSTDPKVAVTFSYREYRNAATPTRVLYHVEAGARAVRVANLSSFTEQREWITGGTFDVISAMQTGPDRIELYLRHKRIPKPHA